MTRILGVIPARYGSTRFPGKALAPIAGRPMIEHVYRRCLRSKLLSEVIVATDDERIRRCVQGFGGTAMMTSMRHQSGTDRIAEALRKYQIRPLDAPSTSLRAGARGKNPKSEIVVNIQGDEPLVSPRAIDQLAQAMIDDPELRMATLATGFKTREEVESPNTAKIVVDREGFALYFSRAAIPFARAPGDFNLRRHLKHIGMYAYRADFLLQFTAWKPGRLERIEKLEQLRALEHGVRIRVIPTRRHSPSVDTPDDLRRLRKAMEQKIRE
ncbi:MAG: 3-deoxy-manno-octulosonate cytidylyltransferase [Candidatus Edwardsbacteria bacterium]|nr:3-deoxy-manno-octulosonate cytidylyltransferase [Candidatus Edwardsbacteria bacterium]